MEVLRSENLEEEEEEEEERLVLNWEVGAKLMNRELALGEDLEVGLKVGDEREEEQVQSLEMEAIAGGGGGGGRSQRREKVIERERVGGRCFAGVGKKKKG